jgi:hypothetical protein
VDLDLIIKIAAVVGAFGTIGGGFVAVYKTVRKIEKRLEQNEKNSESLKSIEKKVEQIQSDITTIHRHTRENHKSVLQLKIVSSAMPMSERVEAANEYLSDEVHGNGGVKAYCNEHLFPEWAKEQKERSAGHAEN